MAMYKSLMALRAVDINKSPSADSLIAMRLEHGLLV